MRKVTTFSAEAIPIPTAPEPRKSGLGDKVRTALAASLVRWLPYFLLVSVAVAVLGVVFDRSLSTIGMGLLIVAGLYVIGTLFEFANLAYNWTVKLGEYDWEAEIEERDYHRQWEEDERNYQRELAEQARQGPQVSPADRLPITAFDILSRHFSGQSTTRDACEKAGIMTQADWNVATAAFKALGWKQGKTFEPGESLEIAWTDWKARMRIYPGHVQVKTGANYQEVKI